jgi:hypothetical protein
MNLPTYLRSIAFRFTCAAQYGRLHWDEDTATQDAGEALARVGDLLSKTDSRVERWVKLALAGIDAEGLRLDRNGFDAACKLCNRLADACEHLGMMEEV